MHRLVYLCDWLPPDFGAVGQYSVHFARDRAARGEEVVLAGLSSTADSVEEEVCGQGSLRIVRMRRRTYDRARVVRRALWTLATDVRLLWRLRRELWRTDEVLITGAPPYMIQVAVPVKLALGKRLTYRITDFHPECLIAMLRRVPLPLRMLHRWTMFLRRRVDRFEVLGEDQRSRLMAQGISADRITLKRDPSPVVFAPGTPPLPVPDELRGSAVLLYSGNLGVAHEWDTVLAGYRMHHGRGSGRVKLWLNASGAGADLFESALVREGLPVHRSLPVPLEQLPGLLLAADAHLITLRDEFVGYVLPSKVYACIASGRPVVFVGSERSDVHALCAEGVSPERYRRVSVGDAAGFAAVLEEVASWRQRAGTPGRG